MIKIRKKFSIDRKYLKISIYITIVAFLCIAFEKLLNNFVTITLGFSSFISIVSALILPFIYGFIIAYFLDPIVTFFDKTMFSKIPLVKKRASVSRVLSIILSYVIILGSIGWILNYLIPEIIVNVSNLSKLISNNSNIISLDVDLYNFIEEVPFIDPDTIQDSINKLIDPLIQKIKDLPRLIETFYNTTMLAAVNTAKFLFGILLAFYMLMEKNNCKSYLTKLIKTLFKKEKADNIFYNLKRINNVYSDFITGKAIDSLIIGILCFICLTLIKMPYALLISVIVGITNMIPYFGPFIGAIPSVIIVLLVSPIQALILAGFIFVLQQFDGIILGPKILSMSVGLSPLWIIFSITIGGAIGGVFGMFVGVPTVAVIKMFLDEKLEKKYNEKFGSPLNLEATAIEDNKNSSTLNKEVKED